jgi:hypothetical protein
MLDALVDITGKTTSQEFKIAAPLLNHVETLHSGLPGWTEISAIHPDIMHKPKMVAMWARCTDEHQMAVNALRAAKANLMGYGLYIGITTRKAQKTEHERGTIKDAMHIPALWVDLDGGELSNLTEFEPTPSIILATGGGYHAYWMLKVAQYPNDIHRRTMRGLAKALNADIKVAEFARVLRALGSYNTKPERNMVRVITLRWEPSWRYGIEDFAHLAEVQTPVVRSTDKTQYDATIPDWIQEYLDNPPSPGQRNSTLFRVAGGLHDRNWTEQDALGKLLGFAGLDDKEVEQVVHSAFVRPVRGVIVKNRDGIRTAARA